MNGQRFVNVIPLLYSDSYDKEQKSQITSKKRVSVSASIALLKRCGLCLVGGSRSYFRWATK